MKIIINEKEFYSIDLPDEVESPDALFGIIERLKNILSVSRKSVESSSSEDILSNFAKVKPLNSSNNKHKIFFRKVNHNRNNAIKLLQFYFHDTLENKKILAAAMNTDWNTIAVRMFNIRTRWSVLPNEAGLTRFPTRRGEIGLHLDEFVYDKNILNYLINLCNGVKDGEEKD